ncbi:hypothetical protein [Streptomyces sp. LN704]|uniref:hypothetical protein n=1 Tax=Streptomyces sp. LN704 TaxID=3112982 RepID=UPI00371FBE23
MIRTACRALPEDHRDDREQEWSAEVEIIACDPDIRIPLLRTLKTLQFAASLLLHARATRRAYSTPTESASRITGAVLSFGFIFPLFASLFATVVALVVGVGAAVGAVMGSADAGADIGAVIGGAVSAFGGVSLAVIYRDVEDDHLYDLVLGGFSLFTAISAAVVVAGAALIAAVTGSGVILFPAFAATAVFGVIFSDAVINIADRFDVGQEARE